MGIALPSGVKNLAELRSIAGARSFRPLVRPFFVLHGWWESSSRLDFALDENAVFIGGGPFVQIGSLQAGLAVGGRFMKATWDSTDFGPAVHFFLELLDFKKVRVDGFGEVGEGPPVYGLRVSFPF